MIEIKSRFTPDEIERIKFCSKIVGIIIGLGIGLLIGFLAAAGKYN